jgi:hypothetical protein
MGTSEINAFNFVSFDLLAALASFELPAIDAQNHRPVGQFVANEQSLRLASRIAKDHQHARMP